MSRRLGRRGRPATGDGGSAGAAPVADRFPPGHHHSPIPSAADLAGARPVEPVGIDLRLDGQVADLAAWDVRRPTGPRFAANGWFDDADAAVLGALVRARRPARVVEVGAGWSTAALFDALDDLDPATGPRVAVTLIDPDLARVRERLTDADLLRCDAREARLQDVGLEPFLALAPGDLLLVDSSHVAKHGSDVTRLFAEILPQLAPGVAVQFHDVWYPFEYPHDWVAMGRLWNEAYVLRAFLTGNADWAVLCWLDALARHDRLADAELAAALDRAESRAVWIERVGGR